MIKSLINGSTQIYILAQRSKNGYPLNADTTNLHDHAMTSTESFHSEDLKPSDLAALDAAEHAFQAAFDFNAPSFDVQKAQKALNDLIIQYKSQHRSLDQIFITDDHASSPFLAALIYAFERPDQAFRNALLGFMKQFMDEGGTIDFTPPYRSPALLVATCCNDYDLVDFLLNHGANPNLSNHQGETPLHRAAIFHQEPALLNRLLSCSQLDSLDALDQRGRSALFRSLEHLNQTGNGGPPGDTSLTILRLIEAGAALDGPPEPAKGTSALHLMSYNPNTSIARALIAAGASVDAPNEAGHSLFQMATCHHNAPLTRLILEQEFGHSIHLPEIESTLASVIEKSSGFRHAQDLIAYLSSFVHAMTEKEAFAQVLTASPSSSDLQNHDGCLHPDALENGGPQNAPENTLASKPSKRSPFSL